MQYLAKKWDTQDITINQDGSATFNIRVISCITGDTYDFVRGDNTQITVQNYSTKTGGDINTELTNAVNTFVLSKYPNT